MITAGRIAGTLALVIIVGWIFWLTGRVQTLLNLAETLVDRDHGPALPPEDRHVDTPTQVRDMGARPAPTRHEPVPPVTVYTVTDQPTDPGTVPMTVPEPATDEIPVVRPVPTQPQAAVLVAHWSAGVDDFEQRQQRMLDEARNAIRQIAEGVA